VTRFTVHLLPFIVMLTALTLLLEAYGRILPPTADALLDICPLPCVMGITPNVTLASEVEEILTSTLPSVNRTIAQRTTMGVVSRYDFEVSIGGQFVMGSITLADANNASIRSLSFNAQFPLRTLFEKWGTPDCVQINLYDGIPAAGVLSWQRATYFAQALFVFQAPTPAWNTALVQSVMIAGFPTDCGTDMQTWRGFAPVWSYQ